MAIKFYRSIARSMFNLLSLLPILDSQILTLWVMERRQLLNFIFILSFFGNFHLGKCLYVSSQVSDSICEQHGKFVESGELQKAVKSGSGSAVENDGCGWYQIKKGPDAGCGGSIATFFECKIIEQRQSPEFNAIQQQRLAEAASQGSGRIVGGEDALDHEFPSIAPIFVGGSFACSVNIISSEWGSTNVVTAGHCVGSEPSGEIIAGVRSDFTEPDDQNPAKQRRQVVEGRIHEKYEDVGGDLSALYDIAVLKVAPPFELNDKVQAVILPDPEYRADGVFTIAGFGKTNETGYIADCLQKVELPFVDDTTCNEVHSKFNLTVYDYMICAGLPEGGKDSCQGDSGGPMYKIIDGDKQLLAGIVSWSVGCARPGIPAVYTEVAYFRDWIKKYTCV